jgi:thymidylate kinase
LTPRICIVGSYANKWYGLQLDLHEGILPYKTTTMFPVNILLSRKTQYNNISVANDDDADLIAFLKEILNNGKCKESYFIKARIAWIKNKVFYSDILLEIYGENFIKLLSDIFESDFNKVNITRLANYGQTILTNNVSVKIANIKSMLSRYYRFLKPPGFTIAVLGTDGAGKTTIIDAIRKPLNETVHNELHYEHMRPNLIPNIAQLFGKKKQNGPIKNPHFAKPSGKIGSLLRLLYYSYDYIVGYWLKVYPVTVKKSSIWIFDRYYSDYLIDQKRARINLPLWIVRGVGLVIPKPDLILCLGADAELIHNRKPELTLEEVTRQVSKLKVFCESTNKATWIDTGNSLDESVNETMEIIIKTMALRYKDE